MSRAKQFAISVVATLRDRGHQAYLCGGCVRDLLLGHEPADYDVTTDATPQQVMRIFPQTYAVGAQFGVVLVPIPKGPHEHDEDSSVGDRLEAMPGFSPGKSGVVEVATFRSDVS